MKSLLPLFTFFTFSFTILGQSPIDSNNSVDWSIAGLENEITPPTTSINVVTNGTVQGNGSSNDGPAIQALIDSAVPGTELYFPAGVYAIADMIEMRSGIAIRGECPSSTWFKFKLPFDPDVNDPCIQVLTYDYKPYRNVIGSYERKVSAVRVADVSDFTIGKHAEIQQENDPVLMYTDPTWIESWAEGAVGQILKITDIVGDSLYFWPPLNIEIFENLMPTIRPTGLISDVSIKNIFIERLDFNESHTIEVKNAYNCLIQNIESKRTHKAHVNISQSINIAVKDSYFRLSHDYGSGGHGYGVEMSRHATNCLAENNIFETLRHSMMVHIGANGNVFGYNYSRDPTWEFFQTAPDISVHGHYPSMNLFEGNIVQRIAIADFWGPSGHGNTYFRNRVENDNIDVYDHSHFQNIVGNELTAGNNTIAIDGSVLNTFLHGNNTNGIIGWDGNSIQNLPPSLYLPDNEFRNAALPFIGPDITFNSGSIPAKNRYHADNRTYCHGDVYTTCIPLAYTNIIAGGGDPASQTTTEGPEKINDGNPDGDVSRWSRISQPPDNLAYVQFQLVNGLQPVQALRMAWWRGDIRTAEFDIFISTDGVNYNPVSNFNNGNFTTSGTSLGFEVFSFDSVMAEYIQIRGYGNSDSDWVSIAEVEVYGNCGINCPEVRILNQDNIASNVYQSSQQIFSEGSVLSPNVVRYTSNEVYLHPEFRVEEGSVFQATNVACQ